MNNMESLWSEILASKMEGRSKEEALEFILNKVAFRPILYIGLGGFGCKVIRSIKTQIAEMIPIERVREGFAFLGLDTHPHNVKDVLTENEYVSLSTGIVPHKVAEDPEYEDYLGWYKTLAGSWYSPNVRGANMVRAVGRLAFLYPPTISSFYSKLESSVDQIVSLREKFNIKIGPKIYIISSLAGGTGSGVLLDVIIITKKFLELKYQGEHVLQVILATPEALLRETPNVIHQDLLGNTYAALKEIFYLMLRAKENISYKAPVLSGEIKIGEWIRPQIIYLVTDRNTEGKVMVDKFYTDLKDVITNFLFSEIITPLPGEGEEDVKIQVRVYDRENVVFSDIGHRGMPRFLSSFGAVRFGLPYEKIEDILALLPIYRAIRDELDVPADYDLNLAKDWIVNNNLAEAGSDQLQENIRKDREGREIIEISVSGVLEEEFRKIKRTEVGKFLKKYKNDTEKNLKVQYYTILEENAKRILEEAQESLKSKFDEIIERTSLGAALQFLSDLKDTLEVHRNALSEEYERDLKSLEDLKGEVDERIKTVIDVAGNYRFMWRRRIKPDLQTFEEILGKYLYQKIIVWSQELGLRIYDSLLSLCDGMQNRWNKARNAFELRMSFVKNKINKLYLELDKMADMSSKRASNRISIVNSRMLKDIYSKYIGEDLAKSIALRTRGKWREKGLISDLVLTEEQWVYNVIKEVRYEIREKIKDLDLATLIEEFYPSEREKKDLLSLIVAFASPLYPLDKNKMEKQYYGDYLIAIHPEIYDFCNLIRKYIPSEYGLHVTLYGSKHEAILYSIFHGYTAHSLTTINLYKYYYDSLQENYKRARDAKIPYRPIHAWEGAEDWEEPIPQEKEEEDAYKWFVLGRAFSYLYPTVRTEDGKPDDKKNRAYIYNKGGNNYYFIHPDKGIEIKLGHGLENAFKNFEDNLQWQEIIRKLIEKKIDEVGIKEIRERIEREYMPVIDKEIETSTNASRRLGRKDEYSRLKLLRELRKALKTFVEEELRVGGI